MSSAPDSTFADRLQKIRDDRKLSQSDLARKAGLQPSAIAHFEAGRRRPSFANIRTLALALDVSTDYLLGAGQSGTTAFRNEEKLSDEDRKFIQDIINTRVQNKTEV